jgi:flagellar protein FlaF
MKAARDLNDREEMLAAVRINWRLWTIIQAELLDPQCTVPMDIRTNVLSLAQFVDKHSVDVIGKPEDRQLDILISINREIAGGLFTAPRPQSQEAGETNSAQDERAKRHTVEPPARVAPRFDEGPSAGSSVRVST